MLMGCGYFIDSLNDPNLALKVRERSPKTLIRSALIFALQLEVWANDADQTGQEQQTKDQRPKDPQKTENFVKWTRVRTKMP